MVSKSYPLDTSKILERHPPRHRSPEHPAFDSIIPFPLHQQQQSYTLQKQCQQLQAAWQAKWVKRRLKPPQKPRKPAANLARKASFRRERKETPNYMLVFAMGQKNAIILSLR